MRNKKTWRIKDPTRNQLLIMVVLGRAMYNKGQLVETVRKKYLNTLPSQKHKTLKVRQEQTENSPQVALLFSSMNNHHIYSYQVYASQVKYTRAFWVYSIQTNKKASDMSFHTGSWVTLAALKACALDTMTHSHFSLFPLKYMQKSSLLNSQAFLNQLSFFLAL